MRTKYRVSNRDVYVGPISRMPDRLFENLEFTMNPSFLHQLSVIERRNSIQLGTQDTQPTNTNNNNANNQIVSISRPGYDVKLVSKNKGFVKLHAGHMKHTFNTFGRSGKVCVLKGEMKVKCNKTHWKLNQDTGIELRLNSVYYVKNNSLRNECVFRFVFDESDQ